MVRFLIIGAVLLVGLSSAKAEPKVAPAAPCSINFMRCMFPSQNPFSGARSISVKMHRVHAPRPHRVHAESAIVPNPAGCPRIAFCACAAAVRVFGAPIRSLWAAASWFRFPKADPAPGMVAVRRHHVFVLEAHIDGNIWMAYDANSGNHATRIHARSIAGYQIVNPHA